MHTIVLVVTLIGATAVGKGATVPPGTEVIAINRVPGDLGGVDFKHADHRSNRSAEPLACRDCHHALPSDVGDSTDIEMRCSACHVEVGGTEKVFEGKTARAVAWLKPNGAIDQKSILYHRYCRDACHANKTVKNRRLFFCKTCHSRGITANTIRVRYNQTLQPNANLIWNRCPVGQTWKSAGCVGEPTLFTWSKANSACPDGMRLPTQREAQTLLGGCRPARGIDRCEPCASNSTCKKLFGADDGDYWLSDVSGKFDAWRVRLADGNLRPTPQTAHARARCVQGKGAAQTTPPPAP